MQTAKNISMLRKKLGTDSYQIYDDLIEGLEKDLLSDLAFFRTHLLRLSLTNQRYIHTIGLSQCLICLEIKPFDCFHKNNRSKYNITANCKLCHSLLYTVGADKKSVHNTETLRRYLGTAYTSVYSGHSDLLLNSVRDNSNYLRERLLRVNRKDQKFLHENKLSQCTSCLVVKDFYSFSLMSQSKYGIRNICRDCQKFINDSYTEKKMKDRRLNKKRTKEYHSKYYMENRSQILEYQRAYYKKRKLIKLQETLQRKGQGNYA